MLWINNWSYFIQYRSKANLTANNLQQENMQRVSLIDTKLNETVTDISNIFQIIASRLMKLTQKGIFFCISFKQSSLLPTISIFLDIWRRPQVQCLCTLLWIFSQCAVKEFYCSHETDYCRHKADQKWMFRNKKTTITDGKLCWFLDNETKVHNWRQTWRARVPQQN